MDAREAARLEEHYRRWLRPDWRRFLHPDCERGLTLDQIKAQREDFAIRDRAFETPAERRLRKARQDRALEEQSRFEGKASAEEDGFSRSMIDA